MHKHFHRGHERRELFGRGPFGGRGHFGGHHGGGGHRGGSRIGRLLEHGDLKYVVLALIEEEPRHGYQLIKALEDRTGGAYRPSPGVIYPTLSLLEDEGFVRPSDGGAARKLYEITEEGRAELDKNRAGVDGVFARIDQAGQGADVIRPRIERAMGNLGLSLKSRLSRQPIAPEELDRIVALIDEAAAAIEKA